MTEDFEFTIDHDLSEAHLVVNDAIFQDDSTFTFFNVDLDLTWTAIGDTAHHHDQNVVNEPGFLAMSTFTGNHRPATATGTIFGKNTEFVPAGIEPTIGELQLNTNGSLLVNTGPDAGE